MDRPKEPGAPRHAVTLLILAVLAIAAYANSFSAAFVLDSRPLILNDARVHSLSLQHLGDIFNHTYWWPQLETGLYRPLTTLSYLFNFAILGGGGRPLGYHCVNLLLHIANGFLLFLLVRKLAIRYWPALFAAALWMLHPLMTEGVTNIVGRADELCAIGTLSALLLYIRASAETARRETLLLYAAAAVAIAVFSKESGVMAIAIVALYDLSFNLPRGPASEMAKAARKLAGGYVYLLAPAVVMLGARWSVLHNSGVMEIPFGDNPLVAADLLTRWGTAMRVIGKYLALLVWPQTLSIDYSYNQVPLFQFSSITWRDAAAVAAILGLLAIAAYSYRRGRLAFFLIGFSGLALLPASNFLFATGTIMGERLLYLPAAGFAAALSLAAFELVDRLRMRPLAAMIVLTAVGCAYGARTWHRNVDWHDEESLFASTVQAAPDSYKAHLMLAGALAAKDPGFTNGERAIVEAERAESIVGSLPENRISTAVYIVLSTLYRERGDSLPPRNGDGASLLEPGNAEWYRKALAAALRGVAVDKAQNDAHRAAELARGTPPEAIGNVSMPDVYANLGIAYMRLGDVSRGIEAFRAEKQAAPALPTAYANLAAVAMARNQTEEAATLLLESYILGRSPATLALLARAYRRIDGGDCAITQSGDAHTVNRDCPVVRRHLCDAYRDLESTFRQARLDQAADRIAATRESETGCR